MAIRKAALTFIFVTVVLDMLALGLIVPVLPGLILSFKGGNSVDAAYIYGLFGVTFAAMQFFFAPILGAVSDKFGRRPMILLSNFGLGFDYILMAVAPSLAWLFLGRVIAGICAASFSIPNAYIADVTPPEGRARGMGMIGAAFGLGFIIGPALGGVVAGNDLATADLKTPGLIAAGLSFVAFVGVVALLKESLPQAGRARPSRNRIAALRAALGRPVLSRLVVVFFLVGLAFAGMEATFALWAMRQFSWGPAQVGYIFTYVGLLSAVMQGGLIGPLTRRLGEKILLLGGLALIAIGLLLLPLAAFLAPLLVAVTALALGMGAMQPSLNSLISRRAGLDEQGEVMGVAQSVGSLSRVLGPAIAGALFAGLGPDSPFVAGAIVVAAALLVGLRLPRRAPVPVAAGQASTP